MSHESPTVLVLRTCAADLTSYEGAFKWPASGPVSAPDWDPSHQCGNGLHGFLRGVGDGRHASWAEDAKWLVVRVLQDEIVDLGQKVKFPRGVVVYCGDRQEAASIVKTEYPELAVIGASATAGYLGTATAGDRGTANAGYQGTATAGHYGTATAGDGGTAAAGHYGTAAAGDGGKATAGDDGTATAGRWGKATAGYQGTATAGHYGTAAADDGGTAAAGDGGTATAGYGGTAAAGDRGTATAGDRGTAAAGDRGTATAGEYGKAAAGESGTVMIRYYDSRCRRYRVAIGYVGENGILPGIQYRLDDAHRFVEVEKT